MHRNYRDIISRIATPPLWFDEYAVPRYDKFTPRLCADIYAEEVGLLQIACQNCHTLFEVCMSSSAYDRITRKGATLAGAIGVGTVAYGDPPNVDCCPAGPTMSSDAVRVIEYWKREDFEWVREHGMEIALQDEAESAYAELLKGAEAHGDDHEKAAEGQRTNRSVANGNAVQGERTREEASGAGPEQ